MSSGDHRTAHAVHLETVATVRELVVRREWRQGRLALHRLLASIDPEGWCTLEERHTLDLYARVLTALELVEVLRDSEAAAVVEVATKAVTPARQRFSVEAARSFQESGKRWREELDRALEELLEDVSVKDGAS